MARALSLDAIEALYAQETDVILRQLLTITHPTLTVPIRVHDGLEEVTSRGNVYTPFPFEIHIPPTDRDELPQVRLRFDNVERTLVNTLRSVGDPPLVTLEIVTSEDPDTVEAGPWRFTWRSEEYTAEVVEGRLAFEDVLNDPFPFARFIPATHPALT